MIEIKEIPKERKCPCNTCTKICHRKNCPMSRHMDCKVCGKPMDSLREQYLIFHREIVWEEETECCSKECYQKWQQEIDGYEKEIQSKLETEILLSLTYLIKDIGEFQIDKHFNALYLIMKTIFFEFDQD